MAVSISWSLKLLLAAVLLGAVVLLLVVLQVDGRRRSELRPISAEAIPIGMMGDSDTAPYQDHLSFPPGGEQPGGAFHRITFQWPEVLARLRPQAVDLGPWAVWGVPRPLSFARVRDAVGRPWRGPRKETHQHNLAWASGCESLTTGPWRQAPRLVDVMDEQPQAWTRGVVVIRIGVNSFGKDADLDALAQRPDDPGVQATINTCIGYIREAVGMIHAHHPRTRIVLVGIFDNSHWVPLLQRWLEAQARANIAQGLDRFDNALRAMAAADPARIAFFDDRAWFARHWGGRDAQTGAPAYRTVTVGKLAVTNTQGDSPDHAVLGNAHTGLVWNTLWTQSLVDLIRDRFALPIPAITDDEVERFVQSRLDEMGAAAEASH
ncbi:MAG: SGNH/GDSL hydrolase family protein [Rhizobacter sp.]|nr:SGNH/GDSL hydrolase family protein [Rhizobacter sp.]